MLIDGRVFWWGGRSLTMATRLPNTLINVKIEIVIDKELDKAKLELKYILLTTLFF